MSDSHPRPGPEQDPDHPVRERAYHLWREAGSPEGRSDEFWHRARALEEQLRRGGAAGAPSEKESGENALEAVTDAMTEGNVPPHRGVP
jgi:DUF2934 family protein